MVDGRGLAIPIYTKFVRHFSLYSYYAPSCGCLSSRGFDAFLRNLN